VAAARPAAGAHTEHREDPEPMSNPQPSPPLCKLLLTLAGFVLVGGPLVLFVWHELSELLMGRIHPGPLALAAVLLGVFLWLASRLGRRLQKFSEAL
jgi:hypothetical protein